LTQTVNKALGKALRTDGSDHLTALRKSLRAFDNSPAFRIHQLQQQKVVAFESGRVARAAHRAGPFFSYQL
jgi:hypothetical protein